MQDRSRLLAMASRLKPLSVRNYAESRRWQQVEGVKGRLWVLRHDEQPLRQLHIPMDAGGSGFGDAILDVGVRLAEIENREITAVLADLQHPDADILRFRVETQETETGDLLLAADVSLREGARRILLAAASSVISPARHHPRMSRTQAERFVNACSSGQTEEGSYVVKIICPLYFADETLSLGKTAPFTRRTTSLIFQATSELVDAIEHDRVDSFLERENEHPRVSSNLCEALLRMQPSGRTGKVELLVNWASVPSLSPPDSTPNAVSIPTEYFPVIESVYQVLRPTAEESREQRFVGTVESLNGAVGDDGRRSGEVTLAILDSEGESARVRTNLDADQYATAIEAHEEGMGYIVIRGVVSRGVRVGRIDAISYFGRVPEDGITSSRPD